MSGTEAELLFLYDIILSIIFTMLLHLISILSTLGKWHKFVGGGGGGGGGVVPVFWFGT